MPEKEIYELSRLSSIRATKAGINQVDFFHRRQLHATSDPALYCVIIGIAHLTGNTG
jgi:hypothetical protein